MALLRLLAELRQGGGPAIRAVTVDHGLRPEAACEAALVARTCAGLGVGHDILRWGGWDGQGNLPAMARRARYGLIGDWARGQGIAAVALGHTGDDQAETFLMRLARGSGVDGLSAMRSVRLADGILWLRPLLDQRRASLRDWLVGRGAGWAEDPTNDDPSYDRVKARAALPVLAPLGLTVETLVATADWMRLAREVLGLAAATLARDAVRGEAGDLLIDAPSLAAAPAETRLRLLATGLGWVSGARYRPRLAALTGLWDRLAAGRPLTLAGCLITPAKTHLRLTREAQAVAGLTCAVDALWDGRWRLSGPAGDGDHVAALGAEGLAQCPGWRAAGLPRSSLIAGPGVWRGGQLVAAPLAGYGADWSASLTRSEEQFFTMLIAH